MTRRLSILTRRYGPRLLAVLLSAIAAALALAAPARAQDATIRDLTTLAGSAPVRLVGYGLVTGLSGTGDRVTGSVGARHTVQSIANLLRNFEVQVPAQLLRTRNVAAVLVTAEVSPFLRPGGRFDVQVSSIGDAQSLRGGVLWMTPLVSDVGGNAMGTAQGQLLLTESQASRGPQRLSTSGRVPGGGIIESDLPRPDARRETQLLLREPDALLAYRIAAAIDSVTGRRGSAEVVDAGAITIKPRGDADNMPELLAMIADVRIARQAPARLLVDARDGTVVAGASLVVGDGVISTDGISLSIGRGGQGLPSGATVQDVAEALRAARATAQQTASVFLALRDAGALRAEVVVR
jgi:flagellar P-ring protein precursor FlgI